MPRIKHVVSLFVFAVALLGVGCGKKVTQTKPKTNPPSKQATPNDDPAAIRALEEAGFILKKNSDGLVVELSISAKDDISESFQHLSGIPNVATAKFTGPGMADKGLEAIESLTNLRRLDFSESRITDKTLDSVAKIKNLEVLGLIRVAVSDEALGKLASLKKLRAIDLR